ncbi:MAG: hypothetical protein KC931_16065, partial [Candidatus Omnitrophica bacterium]|nr:hypothetical protein [Candidatus Omnitrophota bacterium]
MRFSCALIISILLINSNAFSQPADPSGAFTWGLRPDKTRILWTDNSSNEDEFRVERSTNGGAFAEIGSVLANETHFDDATVNPSNVYHYRVRAYRASDMSYSGYTLEVKGPDYLESSHFRVFYNTDDCYPSSGGSTHCTPSDLNAMSQNEYAARILEILEGAY